MVLGQTVSLHKIPSKLPTSSPVLGPPTGCRKLLARFSVGKSYPDSAGVRACSRASGSDGEFLVGFYKASALSSPLLLSLSGTDGRTPPPSFRDPRQRNKARKGNELLSAVSRFTLRGGK